MDLDFISKQISELEEKLQIRKALQDITNRIHAAQNLKQILVDLKEDILKLFDAETMTIYVVDRPRKEIYSMLLAASQLKEIRLPINNSSIAGCTANKRQVLNIADAYQTEEIRKIDKQLTFDSSWDKKSGFTTKQILSAPILREGVLMGVIQILNRKKPGRFSDEEIGFLQEIAEVLAVAFYNQERLSKRRRTRFDYLITRDLLSEDALDSAWEDSRELKTTIEDFLMTKYKISKADLGRSFEEFYHCTYVSYNEEMPIPGDLLGALKKDYLRRELWVPIGRIGDKIRIIVDDPNNILKRDMIESLLKTKAVQYDVAFPDDILKYINLFFRAPIKESSINDLLGRLDEGDHRDDEEDIDGIDETDSIIMQLVNKIINDACNRRSSDIHVEPNMGRKNVEVRFRIDGDCSVYQTLPFNYRAAVVSRIKIMSNLDITIKRLPQDGKIKFKRSNGEEIELRVATIPTQGGGEDVVMRILAKNEVFDMDSVGLSKRNYNELAGVVAKPYGMVLVVGPTGSGKTTTLHAALHHINTPEKKIWTAEDPVEITQYGLRQVQVQPKIGFDFSAAMRSFLRADPDVIMVGEMRDFETAKIGVEASLTGHLVLSTLHTNSAPETIVRLLDMGIDPLNFADSLLGIAAQRLVRTLCKNCKAAYHPTQREYDDLVEIYGENYFKKLNRPYNDKFVLYEPKGCDVCDKSGYKGRMAIHELLINSDEIKRHIQKKATVEVLRNTAMEEGMTTLLQDGIVKALDGLTDIKQVRRVCIK
ncbi:MAG: Flp pilus assembly complex ATPase component TadA [Syntrophobacterales bacterium]|jgi:type II secretory ATPase GspE/PulE/Tfp pilus assembly ATPase PilB-like protein|nr:Flp pilus assembly complex ATPase component TadA [Syntrophobacterales bacterium]